MIRLMKKLSGALAFALLLTAAVAAVYARESVDLKRSDCSLTVVMKYDGKPVAGGSLTLYRVGDITEVSGDAGFVLRPELNCKVNMKTVQSEKTANTVCDCVKRQKLAGITVSADDKGNAVFGNLTTGLYLVIQKTAAYGFSTGKPFLISVPQWDGERYIYNVTAASKMELHKLPPDKPDSPPTPKLPQTGQSNWHVPILLALGAAFLATGLALRRKNNA